VSTAHYVVNNNAVSFVICPSAVIMHWAGEVVKFFLRLAVHQMIGMELSFQMGLIANGLLVMSYECAAKQIDAFPIREFLYCVFDEGHLIKNKASK
jgi:TATA-binding protein-associated factor